MRASLVAAALGLAGCSMPTLTSDGQLVWNPGAQRGATVLTASGVEFVDRVRAPRPAARSSPYDPYTPATGFLLPADGQWHRASQQVSFGTSQLSVTVRVGDALVPAWGGEILLEVEVGSLDTPATLAARRARSPRLPSLGSLPVQPAAALLEESRPPLRLLLIADDVSEGTAALACRALSGLGGGDLVALADTRGATRLTPFLPFSHRSLIEGALRRRAAMKAEASRDLAGTLARARQWLAQPAPPGSTTAVVVVSERPSGEAEQAIRALAVEGVQISTAGPATLGERLPAPAGASMRGVRLSVSSSPAPAHVIEATAGQRWSSLDDDHVQIEEFAAGEARTEVLRLVVPPFVAGEELRLDLRVAAQDAVDGAEIAASHRLVLRYTDDVEALARERGGDVVAYASALALVRRLDRAAFGEVASRPGGMRRFVSWETDALAQLTQRSPAPSIEQRARLLDSLGWALD